MNVRIHTFLTSVLYAGKLLASRPVRIIHNKESQVPINYGDRFVSQSRSWTFRQHSKSYSLSSELNDDSSITQLVA